MTDNRKGDFTMESAGVDEARKIFEYYDRLLLEAKINQMHPSFRLSTIKACRSLAHIALVLNEARVIW